MKGSRIVMLAFEMIISGGVGISYADTIQYSFTTIDVPGFTNTQPNGINDSAQVVGSYFNSMIVTQTHGFLYTASSFTTIDLGAGTVAAGINDTGQIVGSYAGSGFLYTAGSFTTIDVPGASGTSASGINDSGQIVGSYRDSAGFLHGFLYTAGSFSTIDVPGTPSGINDSGQIVGSYAGSGFLYAAGSFTTIDVPGASITRVNGINDSGQIVGSFFIPGDGTHGFLYTGGSFTTIDVPGADNTTIYGINDTGQSVGTYDLPPLGGSHGFLATPVPEPSTLPILAVSLIALWTVKHSPVAVNG